MSKQYFDRYQDFKVDGKYKPLPFIKIEPKNSDKSVVYFAQRTRLDKFIFITILESPLSMGG